MTGKPPLCLENHMSQLLGRNTYSLFRSLSAARRMRLTNFPKAAVQISLMYADTLHFKRASFDDSLK
jgi:hypothetical protein